MAQFLIVKSQVLFLLSWDSTLAYLCVLAGDGIGRFAVSDNLLIVMMPADGFEPTTPRV